MEHKSIKLNLFKFLHFWTSTTLYQIQQVQTNLWSKETSPTFWPDFSHLFRVEDFKSLSHVIGTRKSLPFDTETKYHHILKHEPPIRWGVDPSLWSGCGNHSMWGLLKEIYENSRTILHGMYYKVWQCLLPPSAVASPNRQTETPRNSNIYSQANFTFSCERQMLQAIHIMGQTTSPTQATCH